MKLGEKQLQKLGNYLSQNRKMHDTSIEVVARSNGMTIGEVIAIERGEAEMPDSFRKKIDLLYGITKMDFLNYYEGLITEELFDRQRSS